jgi:anti-sigma factor RsiW
MSHPQFEEWLFAEEPLSRGEQAELEAHLQSCAECRHLADSWRQVATSLRHAGEVSPEAGFAARWQSRLEADRLRMHRRQSLAILAFSLFGAGLLLVSLLIATWPLLAEPQALVLSWLYRAVTVIMVLGSFEETATTLFGSAARAIPAGGWVLFAGLLTEMVVLWVVSFRLLTNPRRVKK